MGIFLSKYQAVFNIIAGIVIILLGIYYILGKETFIGVLISFVWMPCSGPVLAAVLTYASTTSSPFLGGLMLFIYSLGISIPFLL